MTASRPQSSSSVDASGPTGPSGPIGSAGSAGPHGSATADASVHLRADGISFSYPDRRVLTDVGLVVPGGRPTGLLGENGSGKSTLLRILAGSLEPDAGVLDVPGPIGLLQQELAFAPSTTLADVVDDALEHSRCLERELVAAGEALAETHAGAGAAARFDDLLARATIADVWNAPARAEEVLAGLGLAELPRGRRLDEVSGGQRGRLSLAHLLIARPTTLLLDEPTNHLDDDAADYLAGLLGDHPGPVLVASHDRAFLDEATCAQLDLDPAPVLLDQQVGGLTAYTGSFTDYLLARMDARERWERRYRDEQEELKRLEAQLRESHSVGHEGRGPRTEARASKKFYADRNAVVVSRRVRDAERRLEDLRASQIRRPPAELHFTGMPAGRTPSRGDVLVSLADAAVAGRLAPTSLSVSAGEKVLITGPNGAGKSTLLALIAGQLEGDAGSVSVARDHALLAQDEDVDPDLLVRSALTVGDHGVGPADGRGGPADGPVPELMGLVHPRDLPRRLGELSRGQQRRVALAALLRRPPALLLLDEPTNHLSLDLATRLERAIQEWEGTVVIASHDRWLRRRWTGRRLDLQPS